MSDEKLYTERDVLRWERAAFVDGANWWRHGNHNTTGLTPVQEARRRYPITHKVPRVIRLTNDVEVRHSDGVMYSRRPGYDDWVCCQEVATPENIRRLADLLANPYEEVAE